MGGRSTILNEDAVAPSRVRFLVLAWLCGAAMLAYMPRNCLGVAESVIRADLGLTKEQMGWLLGAAFFLPYALFQLPGGWLAQVVGSRRLLPVLAVGWSVPSLLTGLPLGLPWLWAMRLVTGAAQAGLFPGATATVGHWFPATARALPSGALGSFMSIGGAVTAVLTAALLAAGLPWPWIFVVLSAPGLLWALGFYLWFRDDPQCHPAVNAAELRLIGVADHAAAAPLAPAAAVPWLALAASPALWWISGQQFFRAAGYIFFATWFTTYLKNTRDITLALSGFLSSLPLVGVVLGSLVGGLVSDWIMVRTGSRRLSRQGLAAASQLGCAVLIVLAYPVADASLAVLLISLGSFCASLGASCAYSITIDMGGRHVPAVFSIMNMAGNFGAMAFPVAVSYLVGSTDSWDAVLFLFAGTYLAAALAWLLLKPDGSVLQQSLIRHEA